MRKSGGSQLTPTETSVDQAVVIGGGRDGGKVIKPPLVPSKAQPNDSYFQADGQADSIMVEDFRDR